MSELTQCNFCRLSSIRRDAKKKKKKVIIVPAGFNMTLGGYNIHLINKGEKPTEKNKACWFMAITGVCVC